MFNLLTSGGDGACWAFLKPNTPPVLRYYKFRELKPNDIRIQVEWAGLCHSDVHCANSEWGDSSYPIVPGHEILGRICALGSNIKQYNLGDRVGFGPFEYFCGDCETCMTGDHNLCPLRRSCYDPNFGGYNTHYQGEAKCCFRWPEKLWVKEAAPLLCAGATLFSAIANHCQYGTDIGIIGIGGLGHMGVKFASRMGLRVTAFSGKKDKESIKKLGAYKVVNSRDLGELMMEEGQYHTVITTVPQVGEEFDKAFHNLLKPKGKFVQVGIPQKDAKMGLDHC